MRRPVRRPHRLVVFASLVTLVAATVLTTGPVVLAAKPDSGSTAIDVLRSAQPEYRGAIDVGRLPAADPAAVPVVHPRLASPFDRVSGDSGSGRVHLDAAPPPPVEASETTNPAAGQPGWPGLTLASTLRQPPDPWVAAGPDHVVQTTNVKIQIWNRTGTLKKGPVEIGTADFFDILPGSKNSDPRVIYDSLHGRWIATEVSWLCDSDADAENDSVGFLDFLVSRTADPTGVWDLYAFGYLGFLPDYPAPGTSTDKIGLAANFFTLVDSVDCTGAPSEYAGTAVEVVDWAETLAGGGANNVIESDFVFFDDGTGPPGSFVNYFTARVALQTPATSSRLFLVVQHHDVLGLGLKYATVDGSVNAGSFVYNIGPNLGVAGIVDFSEDPPAPLQPGGTEVVPLTGIDSRPTDAIWQNGLLTIVATMSCTPTGDSVPRACVRVTQLGATAAAATNPSPRQDFLIAESGAYHFYGGIGQSGDGSLHVVWTRSEDDVTGGQPSSLTSYQLPGDPDNSLSPHEVLAPGTGVAFTGGRWGDYVGVAQDPQVPNAVWQANQFATGGANWATKVSQLQTGGATYVPIDPLRVVDSRTPVGVTGIFTASVPRTFQVAGVGTIPAGAIAVTGNVTVTGQTAAGYVSITTTPTSTPGSSTLNFPTKDNRANNVTTPLASNGSLAAVYKAAAGKKSHVIFDVTGYFLPGPEDAGYNTVAPVRVLDTRTPIGLAGRFATGTPRQLTVGGVGGIPANAVAITANLTVVGQEKAGFVSVTPTSVPSPATSNLNFPTGDIRANGLTAKLTAGKLWLVYKATGSTTARTHLVLDVTGYYLAAGSGLKFFPLTPGRIMDTRSTVLTGLTGTFTHNASRALDTDGHWGVPAGAKAVTGNLTVVGQTKAGYVSITPNPDPNPSTSTINFPLGDTRANGVTVPLSAGGNMSLIYKASAGKKTHLILDVTGYFK